jgi:hypothetical protein
MDNRHQPALRCRSTSRWTVVVWARGARGALGVHEIRGPREIGDDLICVDANGDGTIPPPEGNRDERTYVSQPVVEVLKGLPVGAVASCGVELHARPILMDQCRLLRKGVATQRSWKNCDCRWM